MCRCRRSRRRLRVSQIAVYGWRKRWRAGGEQALASNGVSVPAG
nr:helix-turn-helix domain-containing protein [Micromonospora sp. KC207]